MNYHWNWLIFWDASQDGDGTYLTTMLSGLGLTLSTALSAWIMALVLGITVGILHTLPNRWIVRLASAYIELFRNIPLLVQMFLWYFVVPEILPRESGQWIKSLPNSSFITAVIALGFYTSARISIQISAGIKMLPKGQRMAATALGLSLPQAYRYVLLPMALRVIIPPLTSEFIGVIKNSAVALTIGLMELTARARSMAEFSYQTFEAFTAATILYIFINILVVRLMWRIERKVAIPGFIANTNVGKP